MEDATAYIRIARKIEEQDPHTAPKAEDGSIHEAFINHLKLLYSSEEAEIVQHLNVLDAIALDEKTGQIQVAVDKCIGCGICTLACPQETLKLHRVERSSIAFETSRELDEAMSRQNREWR